MDRGQDSNAMWLLLCLQGTTHHLYLDQVILHKIPPSVQKLTTHFCLSKKFLPLCAHFSWSLFQFIFTKWFKFYQFALCWFSRKRDTTTLQFATYLKCMGSLELAALHRSPEAVASVPGRNNPVTDASFKNWYQVHRYTLKH